MANPKSSREAEKISTAC